jgi:hypothetical protein
MAIDQLRPLSRAAAVTAPVDLAAQSAPAKPPAKSDAGHFGRDAALLGGAVAVGHAAKSIAFAGTAPEATSFVRPITTAVKAQLDAEFAGLGVNFNPKVKVDWSSYVKDRSTTLHLNRFKFSSVIRKVSQQGMADTSFMHLVRHEAGHSFFNAAMRPHLATKYTSAFGQAATAHYDMTFWNQVTSTFTFKKSPDFVSKYAQTHAAEDFAETFGVYLRLGGNKTAINKYVAQSGKSLVMKAKFNFVDDLVKLAVKRL